MFPSPHSTLLHFPSVSIPLLCFHVTDQNKTLHSLCLWYKTYFTCTLLVLLGIHGLLINVRKLYYFPKVVVVTTITTNAVVQSNSHLCSYSSPSLRFQKARFCLFVFSIYSFDCASLSCISLGPLVVTLEILNCSMQTFSCGMWDLVPNQGLNLGPFHQEHGLS